LTEDFAVEDDVKSVKSVKQSKVKSVNPNLNPAYVRCLSFHGGKCASPVSRHRILKTKKREKKKKRKIHQAL